MEMPVETETQKKEEGGRGPLVFLVLVVLVILGSFIAWPFLQPARPWGRIGAFIGLISLVALIFRDFLNSFGTKVGGNYPKWKEAARNTGLLVVWLFAPLTVIAAFYQFKDTEAKAETAEQPGIAKQQPDNPDPRTFIEHQRTLLDKNHYEVEGRGLLRHLLANMEHSKRVDATLAELWYPELMIVNCGSSVTCACPEHYEQVKYTPEDPPNWNLNARIKGHKSAEITSDAVNLCWRKIKYAKP